ncbi:fructoselysine 6-kinase [Kitasatospora atroaurantiaca]|uniref:Sugar/nucleoside kinase (Ribokinase family) n=1 Tax=Kitasatospora atroaurantiaca TaxID=285545 RepID=A0A561EJH3_9ACTN|nr:carbohydrate kinase family protein [Kitasatospora atroaurantiaca]TWE15761.1 sugar/nucleoside kinase (ribokinase family) [Kitasatospora atroaurantiaca]
MTELDVLVVGGVGVDTIVRVPELPLPLRETIRVPHIHQYVGHTGNGVALGCHHLGLRTHLADVIGADPEGDLVRARYAEAGLSFGCLIHPSGTRRSVNLVDPQGRRQSLYDGRHPAGMRVDPELYREPLALTRHAHISLIDWARRALADAIDAGLSTSTDLHNWDGKEEYRQDFAYGAELVFLSTNALGARIEETAEEILARGRAKAVVAMAGGHGSYLKLPGRPLRHVPSVEVPPEQVVDTNGAGDSYVAAFLYAWLSGRAWEECARAGSMAGAHAVRAAGTHTSFITAEELDAALS